MAQAPTGTTFHIATAYGASVPTTGVTNATEAVVTAAAHGFATNDIVEIASGWGRLHLRVFRIKNALTNTFVLEGMDTTNVNFFPAGTGTGTVRKITAFTQITQVINPQTSGGEPKTIQYKYVESDVEYSINDGFTASNSTLELDADAINTAGYAALKQLTEVQTNTCLKTVTRAGSLAFQPCTVALNESLRIQDGQINKVNVAFNGNNRLTRYAS